MKPATFDGTSSWIDYKSHFDMCADINSWSLNRNRLLVTRQNDNRSPGSWTERLVEK